MYPTSHLSLIDIAQNTPGYSPELLMSLCLQKPPLLWKVSIHCPLWGKVNASIGTEPCLPSYLFKSPSPCPPDLSSRITFCQHPSLTPNYPSSLTAALSLGSGFQGKTFCLVSSTLHSVKEQEAYPGYMAPCLPPCHPPQQSQPASAPC